LLDRLPRRHVLVARSGKDDRDHVSLDGLIVVGSAVNQLMPQVAMQGNRTLAQEFASEIAQHRVNLQVPVEDRRDVPQEEPAMVNSLDLLEEGNGKGKKGYLIGIEVLAVRLPTRARLVGAIAIRRRVRAGLPCEERRTIVVGCQL